MSEYFAVLSRKRVLGFFTLEGFVYFLILYSVEKSTKTKISRLTGIEKIYLFSQNLLKKTKTQLISLFFI